MSLLFTYNVEDHEKHKNKLIELINLLPRNRNDAVSHTDWNLPVNMQKEWQGYFFKNILYKWKDDFSDKLGEKIAYNNIWFQWYDNGDYHDWHTHAQTHFTNIYYLNLPYQSIKTKVKVFGETKNIDIQEGQIISFPGFWKHSSPVNNTDQAKIIISFNTDVVV